MESTKDLNYYKNNCEEDYINTPISVLRYITELEQALQLKQDGVSVSFNKLVEQFNKETEMNWFRSPNAFNKWINER